MAGTFSQIYIQIVFAVKGRESLLLEPWREEVFKYMAGIVNNKDLKSIIINGMPDHVHLFIGIKPSCCISDLVRDIKNNSAKFIKDQSFFKGSFSWQQGYGAFSYAHSQIGQVYDYIKNQQVHHKTKSFRDEYLGFLKKFDVPFEDKYLFEWLE